MKTQLQVAARGASYQTTLYRDIHLASTPLLNSVKGKNQMFQCISFLTLFAIVPSLAAKAADYVCVVTVPNAGDAIQNSAAGQPRHLYVGVQTDFLGKQSAEDHAKDFLLHVHYYAGQGWEKDPFSEDGNGIAAACTSFDNTTAARAYLMQQYPSTFSTESNAYISKTNFDGRPES